MIYLYIQLHLYLNLYVYSSLPLHLYFDIVLRARALHGLASMACSAASA